MSDPSSSATLEANQPVQPGGMQRVLLVEDHPDHADLIEFLLARGSGRAWAVERAETLADALARASASPPAVVILDLNLPDSRGLETVNRFCGAQPDLPVVVATSDADEDLGVSAVVRGAQDYLVKGFIQAELLARSLRLAIARKRGELVAARLAAIVEASEDAIIAQDLEGRITAWNAGAERLYSYGASEAVGLHLGLLEPSDRRGEIASILDRIRRGEHVASFETTTVRRDGTPVDVSLTVSPVFDPAGRIVGASVIARDITERRRAAEDLRKSQQHLQTIIDSEPECLKIIAIDGTIMEMNPAGLAMLQADVATQVVGRPMLDFVHPEDWTPLLAIHARAAEGEPVTAAFRTVGLRGEIRHMEMRAAPLRDERGGVRSILSVTRDMTDHARAVDALKASEKRYRALFDANPQPMWVYEADSLRFLAVNEAAVRHYGYTRDEFLSMTLRDIRLPEDVPRLEELLAREGRTLRPPAVVRHRKKDGTLIMVEVSSHALELEGRRGTLVIAVDVTERLRLEVQLRQAQKMEALGRLAGGVAHDFNNLLGVITGYSDLALRATADPAVGRRIDEVRKAAARAADLTRQLLVFSRQQVLEPRVLDLNSVVAEAEEMLRRLIGEDVQVSTVLAQDLGSVKADPGQVGQILMNLCANARDAMPEGGRLVIETSNAVLDAGYTRAHPGVKPGPYVMLCVTDSGVGMDRETQARIFEPFFTTKQAGKGTGLGLATVYGIARQSGGHVEVYSEVGSGTSFKVYLPRTGDALEPARHPEVADGLEGGETVLLVEDDRGMREMTRELLEEAGYTVLASQAGDTALALVGATDQPIHLLLTDVILPGMTGPRLAEQLARARPGLRVVFMSGYSEGAILEQGRLPPGAGFVQKPFGPERLLRAIRDVLEG